MTSENLSKNPLRGDILILGGGYIGTHLKNHLGKYFNVITLKSGGKEDYHNTRFLRRLLSYGNVRYVINCSGFTGRPNVDEGESRKEECWELNVLSPLRINQLCNDLGIRYLHISSGCIYNGYKKIFKEYDSPNFGLFDHSSFYSKSKHAFELGSKHLDNKILRIRMPICNDLTNPRNYLNKIMNYLNLVNYNNSKTYIPDLCSFIEELIRKTDNVKGSWVGQDIFNVVNPRSYNTKEVIEHLNIMNEGNWSKLNPNWVEIEDLDITAPRSNCILDNEKADEIFELHSEYEVMNMVCNYNNGIQRL
jgi:dTDP-4-dehydrorhamnose reductase